MPESTGDLIARAIAEDLGGGDLSAEFFIPAGEVWRGAVVARRPCVLAGTRPATETFRRACPGIEISGLRGDGERLRAGDAAFRVSGPARQVLSAERTALNFLQHLSGVATLTAKFVEAVRGTGAKIYDTRKTVPGLRALQKEAVLAGGGHNHRMGLYDMVMLKDNHLAALLPGGGAGGFEKLADAIARFRERHPGVEVSVEADTPEQALAFFGIPGIGLVLLDNMGLDDLRRCAAAKPPGIEIEASGGVSLETVRQIAETGVDRISVGALTHSAPAADFGLDFL